MHAARGKAIPTASDTATPNAARARWNKLKLAARTSRTCQNGGKEQMKRLSTVMKARQNDSGGGVASDTSTDGEAKTVLDVEAAVSMHVDEKTGHRYSYNEGTGHTQWLSDDDEEDEATIEEQGESKQHNDGKKPLFRKFVDGNDDVYYENVQTEEVVWKIPDGGELVE